VLKRMMAIASGGCVAGCVVVRGPRLAEHHGARSDDDVVLSFPSGLLRRRVDRVLMALAIALATLVELVWLVFADSRAVICDECPDNLLQIVRNDGLAEGLLQGQRAAGLVFSL
jgi:hypothetical protein